MLFRQKDLDRIVAGEINLAFRRWTKPSVRAGGRQRTQRGILEIRSVGRVNRSSIRASDAHRAGCESRAELLEQLDRKSTGDIYRIELRFAGKDERIALRQQVATGKDREALYQKLDAMDRRSKSGPWTTRLLILIAENAGIRAGDIAPVFGEETRPFKARVRRLKELGLTESLEVGYRLSARGRAALRQRPR